MNTNISSISFHIESERSLNPKIMWLISGIYFFIIEPKTMNKRLSFDVHKKSRK